VAPERVELTSLLVVAGADGVLCCARGISEGDDAELNIASAGVLLPGVRYDAAI